jgi:(E)-4-hydroxy-3-methylbut-2-enyl-diphosphate synthase
VPEAEIVATLITEANRLADELRLAGVPSGEPTISWA